MLHGVDVAFEVVAQPGQIAAQVPEEVEQDEVVVRLPLGIGLRGAAKEAAHDAEEPFVFRRPRPETAVGVPDLAPSLRACRRPVDELLVTHAGRRISARATAGGFGRAASAGSG